MKQRIRNRGDWFMVGMLVRYECPRNVRGWRPKNGTTWLNSVLIQAASPYAAYRKAMAFGRKDARSTNSSKLWFGKWLFLGLAEIIPVSGDITDGTELLWSDFGAISKEKAKSFVAGKAKLIQNAEKEINSNHTSDGIVAKRAKPSK